jgi:putative glutamine amidotransferase
MHRRPIIGIPTQTLQSLGGIPAEFPPSWVMSQRYIRTLTAAGAIPWMIPLVGDEEDTLRGIYDELDGVFLPGGADIDPSSYKEDRHPLCDRTDTARDDVELTLIKWAMSDRKPALGVCRGVQVINLAAGGTLYQDLADQYAGSIKHDYFPFAGKFPRDYLAHDVEVAQNTRLAEIIGSGPVKVNSMHHQGIRELGGCLIATAIAPDGLIEAAESTDPSTFLMGVQWHPEALTDTDPRMRRLFDEFIGAASEYRMARMVGA